MVERNLTESDYVNATKNLTTFCPQVSDLLERLIESENVRIHSVTKRVKSMESALRKIDTSQGKYSDFSDLKDLLGLRVITYFPDEVDLVTGLIEREFEIDFDHSNDRRVTEDPDRFGYVSVHYVAKLSTDRSILSEFRAFRDSWFEIQIRSILQHSWAEIEHDLGYKVKEAIPRDVRRRFARLAGLLELADAEFVDIRKELEVYATELPKEVALSASSVGIDKDSIAEFIRSDSHIAKIDGYIASILKREFSPNLEFFSARWAQFLQSLNFTNIGQIKDSILQYEEVLPLFAERWISHTESDQDIPPGITLFYLGYLIAAESGDLRYVKDYLTDIRVNIEPQRLLDVFNEVTRSRKPS